MPLFHRPFSSGSSRQAVSLFEIRPESDFIVFRGNETESTSQILKGVVVLCISSPLKVEDIKLRLSGTLRLSYLENKLTTSGITTHRTVKNNSIFEHVWPSFTGGPANKGTVLKAGNYEWPFELVLAGDMAESVEGLERVSITYRLKATITRGKLSSDLAAYKHLRVIRTLDPAALEFVHAMSVENIWPNKIDYSICVPRKAVVFGGKVPLEMRFTPLLKGLEMGDINIVLHETQEMFVHGAKGTVVRDFKEEREVTRWVLAVTREQHWCQSMDEFGQEGWTVNGELDLPRRLKQCMQDANLHGIKIRHKLKVRVALHNPDGHVSELRATLPISIFISPNIPLDEEGNLVSQSPLDANLAGGVDGIPAPGGGLVAAGGARPNGASSDSVIAPPGYGEHLLDQLYEDIDVMHLRTPAVRSVAGTPYMGHSRAVSSENLHAADANAVAAAALRDRLQGLPLQRGDQSVPSSRRSTMYSVTTTPTTTATTTTPSIRIDASAAPSTTTTTSPVSPGESSSLEPLTRQSSGNSRSSSEESSSSSSPSSSAASSPGPATPPDPLLLDADRGLDLSKVPSYATAVRTSARPLSFVEGLPDYVSAVAGGEATALSRRSSGSSQRTATGTAARPGLGRRVSSGMSSGGNGRRTPGGLAYSLLHARLSERVM